MSGSKNPPRPGDRNRTRTWRRWAIAALAVGAAVVGLYASGLLDADPPPDPGPDPFALAPLPTSPYLNTGPDAQYVGSEACRACHASRHASFRTTGMGRSMAEVDPAGEPPDAVFDHPPSGRRYQVRRRGGQLWHRELLLPPGPREVVLAEYPVRYVVGSGRHSRTYLVEIDGFLVESPVTWYTARRAWGMSPGYDTPHQGGFDRATGEGCLDCHAGRAEAIDRSLNRMRVTEAAIGCERCHGPGSIHVARHRDPAPLPPGEIDRTIVNPAKLPRELAEAVCQQCHLRSDATVIARGREASDFRPGLPLQAFRADYRVASADGPMMVVGHVEQLHLSRCYQQSNILTCLTCHSPHAEPTSEGRVAHYRDACLSCHAPDRCTVDPGRRQIESPDNDCTRCHMPTAPTEVPHLAFTHHRIGLHPPKKAPQAASAGAELRPFLDLSHLGEIDRQRSLGLGYLEAANRSKDRDRATRFRDQALRLLSDVHAAGLRDPAAEVALGRLRFELGLPGAAGHASAALTDPGLAGDDRCTALFLLADDHAAQGRHREAVAVLRELTRLRRHPVDWLLLADCEGALGHQAAREEALTTAARINPRLWKVHQYLAEQYRQRGDHERAAWHQERAVP
ncbi:MAG TPA: cytochrome c3 family protein [Fimbriiglobus sp.]|nr:cytochrome c3 family protein [Fimbriiglobus sp.]